MEPNWTCVELFAGAGGLAIGAERAGFKHLLLNEFNPNACATLRLNRPGWNVVEEDITKLSFHEKPDVVFGGPPCQAFSMAGRRKGLDDLRGTMVFEFIRAVQEMSPKVTVMENVVGLTLGTGAEVFGAIVRGFAEVGWDACWRVLNAVDFGVPQTRKRVFLIAVKTGSGLSTLFPKGSGNPMTVREALAGCPVSEGASYPEKRGSILAKVPPGGNWKDLEPEDRVKAITRINPKAGGLVGLSKRLAWDEPCPTLMCTPIGNFTERCHPEETRPLTVREYARIQTFPDDWNFVGPMASKYKQIGNAVPVNLGFRVAEAVGAILGGVENPDRYERVDTLELW